MKQRPSLALAMIVKNEAHNLSALLKSVKGCFDEIHITDTASTDNTVQVLQSQEARDLAGCQIYVHHFKWVNDFSQARQYSFDQVPKSVDYIMWLDADDVLSDADSFIHWRDNSMHCAHQWLFPYNYAYSPAGHPICTFFRERVVKNNFGFKWNYFVHEGLLIDPVGKKCTTQVMTRFTINHMRSSLDEKQDRMRNLKLFADKEKSLEPRMLYYYGKELFESRNFVHAARVLENVCQIKSDDLQIHDRVMAVQYLAQSYFECNKLDRAHHTALMGVALVPDRAEFYNILGDIAIKQNKISVAELFYKACKSCAQTNLNGFIYTSPTALEEYPAHQLAQIYLNTGRLNMLEPELKVLEKFKNPAVVDFRSKSKLFEDMSKLPDVSELVQTDDIVISTPPNVVTQGWDERVLEAEGLGGSETACVEIARLLKRKTGKPVKVFNRRASSDLMESGVEYLPLEQMQLYLKRYKPLKHIAWRHSCRLTPADSYVWSHDLVTPGGENASNYTKYWCLSGFHKEFTQDMLGLPAEKIDLVKNGIDAEMVEELSVLPKQFGKVIFPSSPDRGLERSIEICKRALKEVPELELHVFYGTGNMRKMGMEAEANRLDELVRSNPFVKYHGFVPKKELLTHMRESCVWLYPADFIETHCITALEAHASGTWPLVRNMGSLKYTLSEAIKREECTFLDEDASCEKEYDFWADELVKILKEKRWEKIDISPHEYDWSTVVDGFLKSMDL